MYVIGFGLKWCKYYKYIAASMKNIKLLTTWTFPFGGIFGSVELIYQVHFSCLGF